jgi:hypothetical protein
LLPLFDRLRNTCFEVQMGSEGVWVPSTLEDLEAVEKRCRAMLTRRALASAGASIVPLPGLDIAADVTLLLQLIPEINRQFGLMPEQIERLRPQRQVVVYKAIVAFGGAFIGRVVTHELIIATLKSVGLRVTLKQASKYLPIAGQALSAVLSFSAMRYVGAQHIGDCARVAAQVLSEEKQAAQSYPRAERVG